jgi:hypothetical protein
MATEKVAFTSLSTIKREYTNNPENTTALLKNPNTLIFTDSTEDGLAQYDLDNEGFQPLQKLINQARQEGRMLFRDSNNKTEVRGIPLSTFITFLENNGIRVNAEELQEFLGSQDDQKFGTQTSSGWVLPSNASILSSMLTLLNIRPLVYYGSSEENWAAQEVNHGYASNFVVS